MLKRIALLSLNLFLLSACGRLASIPFEPEQTPASWLEIQPFTAITIGPVHFVLVQPSSTVFVYLLGLVAIGVGLYIRRIQDRQQARRWWGIALLLWGVGALCAGTSYQAFSYEIKCAGRQLCSWTSWWEIAYLVLSVASVDAMVIAGAYAALTAKWRRALVSYALIAFVLYGAVIVLGVMTLNRFLISFEMLLIFTTPNILLLFTLNTRRYARLREPLDRALIITWLWLGASIGVYFLYLMLDVTHKLWPRGIWFSENDVLHLGLISWMLFIGLFVARRVVDVPRRDDEAAWS